VQSEAGGFKALSDSGQIAHTAFDLSFDGHRQQ
jgi:hypothetical protein